MPESTPAYDYDALAAAPPPQGSTTDYAALAATPRPDPEPIVVGEKQKYPRGKIFSGGAIMDVFDALGSMQYLAAGLAAGKDPKSAIVERSSWEEVLAKSGMKDNLDRTVLGLAGDIILDPLWILTPAKVANVLGKIEPLGRAAKAAKTAVAESKVGDLIQKGLRYGHKVPEDVLLLADNMSQTLNVLKGEIRNVYKDIRALGPKADDFLRGVLENADPAVKDSIVGAARAAGIDSDKLLKTAIRYEALDEEIGSRLVKFSGLAPEARAAMKGQHVRRVYQRFEDVQGHIADLRKAADPESLAMADELESMILKAEARYTKPKAFGVDRGGATLPRQAIPEATRKELGEITDIGYRVAKGSLVGAQAAAEGEFLMHVGSRYARDTVEAARTAWQAAQPGVETTFKALPETARLGEMAGKIVPEPVYRFVQQTVSTPTKWQQLIQTPLSYWKMFKVTTNPAGQVRNAISNLGLLNMAGIPSYRLPDLYVKTFDALRGGAQGPAGDLARIIHGDMASGFVREELQKFLINAKKRGGSFFSQVRALFDTGLSKAADLYAWNEVLGKTAAGIYALENGADLATAISFGEKALFNYAKVPPAVKFLRDNGIVPFASFAYFATDATARAVWQRPGVLTKFNKIAQTVEAQNPNAQQERKAAPEFMRQFGQVFTPLKDKYGRHLVFDATYMIPFGDVAGAAEQGIAQRLMGAASFPTFLYDLATNRSSFTGKQIAPSADLTGPANEMKKVAVQKYIDYIYKFSMPSWMPSIIPGVARSKQVVTGGYAFKNLEDAIIQRPDVFGKTRSVKATILGEIFGLKTRPIDVGAETAKRAREFKEDVGIVRAQMKKVAMDPDLTAEEKRQMFERLNRDIVNLSRAWMTGD